MLISNLQEHSTQVGSGWSRLGRLIWDSFGETYMQYVQGGSGQCILESMCESGDGTRIRSDVGSQNSRLISLNKLH